MQEGMTDRDMLLIAFEYFLNNGNEDADIGSIFGHDINDELYRLLTNKMTGYIRYFDITPPSGGVTIFKLWPHIFNSIHLSGADGFLNEEMEEYKKVEKKESLEVAQMQSVIDTNKSVQDTNTLQKRILWLTAILSSLTLVVSVFDLLKKDTINVPPASVILQGQSPSKDSMIKLIQSVIGVKDTTHKHP